MKQTLWLKYGVLGVTLAGTFALYQGTLAQQQPPLPTHPPVASDGQSLVVQMCDGKTSLLVPGVKPGERLTPTQAQAVSNELMEKWLSQRNPAVAAAWRKEAASATQAQSAKKAPAQSPAGRNQSANEQATEFTSRNFSIWQRELKREIEYGDKLFHDDKLIGSTNGISCAMCHPNAANTHPETYPKYQIQLQRVALLRDMINWCIENPSRGPRLAADDPKMRALEAYIMAQRKGVPMEYGKH